MDYFHPVSSFLLFISFMGGRRERSEISPGNRLKGFPEIRRRQIRNQWERAIIDWGSEISFFMFPAQEWRLVLYFSNKSVCENLVGFLSFFFFFIKF